MVEFVSEPKMVMIEIFLMAMSHTDSRNSSLCWTYILFSSLGEVISWMDTHTHTQRHTFTVHTGVWFGLPVNRGIMQQ